MWTTARSCFWHWEVVYPLVCVTGAGYMETITGQFLTLSEASPWNPGVPEHAAMKGGWMKETWGNTKSNWSESKSDSVTIKFYTSLLLLNNNHKLSLCQLRITRQSQVWQKGNAQNGKTEDKTDNWADNSFVEILLNNKKTSSMYTY